METQNLYEMFSDNKAETTVKNLKAKLAITIMQTIDKLNWSQVVAAKNLNITQPRMSNLKQGKLENFSMETLMGYLVKAGYKFDITFNPHTLANPLTVSLKQLG